MTRTAIMEEWHDEIAEALQEYTEKAYQSHGKVRFVVYCWEDDGIEVVEDEYGGTAKLEVDDESARHIVFVDEIQVDGFDLAAWLGIADADFVWDEIDDEMIEDVVSQIDWDERVDALTENMYYEV